MILGEERRKETTDGGLHDDEITDVIEGAGLDDEVSIRADYSGRAMYGATCFEIVCDASSFALFCAAVGASMDDWDWIGGVRSDGMGLSTIWYWPSVKIEGATEDEEVLS